MVQQNASLSDGSNGFKYWGFVSYSHADKKWGAWLHKALERYRVPRALVGRKTLIGKVPKRIFPIFRDRDELPGAASLAEKITQALVQSRFLIIICSPKSAVSRYVNEEIKIFKRLGREDRILCFIIDGEPGASLRPQNGQLEAFPAAVRYQLGPDGELTDRPAEPLAADARKHMDGKANAKLKLLAGILGVGYDELKQREKQRRRWRVAEFSLLTLLVAGAIGGVWLNRQQAFLKQRIIGQAIKAADESLHIPDRNAEQRLELALRSVNLTLENYGQVQPEATIALYRALTEIEMRGTFVEDTDEEKSGGWAWPVALNSDGSRMFVPSDEPTLVLNAYGDKIAVLKDPEVPYDNDFVARFSHDGKNAVTGGSDGWVRFWTPDGRFVKRFRAHAADVIVVDQTPDSSSLLTVGCDKGHHQSCEKSSAKLWEKTGRQVASFTHDENRVVSAAFSPDGKRIVTADENGALRFWLPSGRLLLKLKKGSFWVTRANFSPDGKQFITGGCHPYLHAQWSSPLPGPRWLCPQRSSLPGSDQKVRLYDRKGNFQREFPGWLATFDPRGTRILTAEELFDERGTFRGRVYLWRPDGRPIRNFPVRSRIVDAGFSPDGRFIYVANDDMVTFHNAEGDEVKRLGGFLRHITSIRFSENGNRLATVSCPNVTQGQCLQKAVHVWDPNGPVLESQQLLRVSNPRFRGSSEGIEYRLNFSPSGMFLFIATNDGAQPVVWNTKTGEITALPSKVGNAWFNPGETRILTIGGQGIRLWDINGRHLKTLLETRQEKPQDTPPYGGESAYVVGVSKRRIIAGDDRGIVYIWSWSGELKGQRKGHGRRISSVDMSLWDDSIVTIDYDGLVMIWDAQLNSTAKIDAGTLNKPPDELGWLRGDWGYKVRFTKDGQRILIVGPKNMSLWNRQGQKQWDTDVDTLDFTEPQVSKDRILIVQCTERGRGATLGGLIGCYDSAVGLWDLRGRSVATLEAGLEGETLVKSATFNPLGNRIVTVDNNGRTQLWDKDGNKIVELFASAGTAKFDPKGGRLATVSDGGFVQMWKVWEDMDSMISEAERRRQILAQKKSKGVEEENK